MLIAVLSAGPGSRVPLNSKVSLVELNLPNGLRVNNGDSDSGCMNPPFALSRGDALYAMPAGFFV